MARLEQLIVYVDDGLAEAVRQAAHRRRQSVSAFAKVILEREVLREADGADAIGRSLASLEIGLDALLKYHPNTKLFGVVKATRQAKLGGISDEG